MAESSFVIHSSKLQKDLDAAASSTSSEKSLSEFACSVLSSIGSSVEAPLFRDVSFSTFLPLEDVEMPSFCDLTNCDEILHFSSGSSSLHKLIPKVEGGTSSIESIESEDFSNIYAECENFLEILNQSPNDTSTDGVLDLDRLNDSLVIQTPKCKQLIHSKAKRSSKCPQMSTPKETKSTDITICAKATANATFTAEEQAKSSSTLGVKRESPQEGGEEILDSTFIKSQNVSYTLEKKVAPINTTFEANPPGETVFNSTFDKPGINPTDMNECIPSKTLNLTFDAQNDADQSHNRTFEVVGNGLFVIEGKTTNLMDMQSNDLQTIFTPVKNSPKSSRHSTPITRSSHRTALKDPLKSSLLKCLSLATQPKSSVGKPLENDETQADTFKLEPLPSLDLMRKEREPFRIKTSTQSRPPTNGPVKAMAVPDAVKALACLPSSPTVSTQERKADYLQELKGPVSTPEIYRARGIGGGPVKTSTPAMGYNHHSQSNLDLVSGVTPIKKQTSPQYFMSSGDVDNVISGQLSFSRGSTIGDLRNSKTPDSADNSSPTTAPPQQPGSNSKLEDADNTKMIVPPKREQSEIDEKRHSLSDQNLPEVISQKLPDDLQTKALIETKLEDAFPQSKPEQPESAEGHCKSNQNPPEKTSQKLEESKSSAEAISKSRVLSRRSLKSLETSQPKQNLCVKRTNSLKLNSKLKAGEVLTKTNHNTLPKKPMKSKSAIRENSQADTTDVKSGSLDSLTGLSNTNQNGLAAVNRKIVLNKNLSSPATNRKTRKIIAPPPRGSNIRPPLKPINKINAKSTITCDPPEPSIPRSRISPRSKPVLGQSKVNAAAIEQKSSLGRFQPPKKFNSLSSNKENDLAQPKKVVVGGSRPRSSIPMPFAPKQRTTLS